MKCPYRTKETYIKPEPKTLSTPEGKITINLIETTDFEDCYGEDCPFYKDDGTRIEPWCARADNEIGSDYI